MKHPSRRVIAAIAVVALVLLAFVLISHWQGPRLAAYQVQAQPLVQTVVATGRVVSVSRAQVGSQISGVVLERRVREGDRVEAGDVLAVLRADDLEANVHEAEAALAQLQQSSRPQAEAVLRDVEARLSQAMRETQRQRTLLERQLIARETLELAVQAETAARAAAEQARLAAAALASGASGEKIALERLAAARAALDKTFIRAQVAGTVLTRNAEPGDVVQPGKVLFDIAREGDTELLVPLDEKNLGLIALDQQATCVADAYPDRPFGARVSFIAPSVDPQRGTLDIRLTVDPVPDYLRQDMTVSVNVETGRREHALIVPNDALADSAAGQADLWMVVDGTAQLTRVTLGLRGLVLSEITSGVNAGDWVLANGAANIADGQRVRIKEEAVPQAGQSSATRNELPVRFN
ncbi:MAG: efflux RND transporter periplasmic adaptor subunit [Xanthomonadales bacterium]|nr:efflux RND transporter periplasmic adaptor subunit [Xanthomonadales bacterium]